MSQKWVSEKFKIETIRQIVEQVHPITEFSARLGSVPSACITG